MSIWRRYWIGWMALAAAGSLWAEPVKGRYIVELSEDPVAERVVRVRGGRRLESTEAVAQRTRVRSEQRRLRSRLEARRARVLDQVETVGNALITEMSEEQAAQVAAMPGVKKVHPVRVMKLYLDRAIELHRVREAWSRIGEERAGAGVKVGIIDTGIEASHAGFRDPEMTAPEGYPKTNQTSDVANTNGKIIVARSYVSLLPNRDTDVSARDRVGHGTALAMIVAGARTEAPLATMTGIAPKAWLGNYKVFGSPGFNDGTSEDAVLKAIDDAVSDGMDILNISLGADFAPRLEDDPTVQAVERATKAGVLVIVAAGNNGPELNTLGSPATAPSSIAVGATTNDRIFGASIEADGVGQLVAIPSDQSARQNALSGAIVDVEKIDGNGLACTALPAGSLIGHVALILRGTCTFEAKINNAQRAGAMAVLVYAAPESPNPITMGTGTATLPAQMISNGSGVAIKEALGSRGTVAVTLRFTVGPVANRANRLTTFTAAGPSVDSGLKPDLMAVGHAVYSATQTLYARGDMYHASGYIASNGTSFSTPVVAGAAALLKSARPGLTVAQYRSLLINTATRLFEGEASVPTLQQTGAGLLDVSAGLRSTVTAAPSSLSFGAGDNRPQVLKNLLLSNLGTGADTLLIEVTGVHGGARPVAERNTVEVAAGGTVDVGILLSGAGIEAGAHEGFVQITSMGTGEQIRVPYWYAVRSDKAASLTLLDRLLSGRRGSTQRDAILFRVVDSAGVAMVNVQPEVTVVSGGGSVQQVVSHDREYPGVFGVHLQLGAIAGENVIRVQVGEAVREFRITGI